MDDLIKYVIYFLLGFIIYKIINYKVEGLDNQYTLLFSVLREREDIGCYNFKGCLGQWENKIEQSDENFFLCNNSEPEEYSSLLNTGNKCNKDLCCENNSCNNKFFKKGHNCGDKAVIPSGTCDEQHQGVDCEGTCCGESISGVIRKIFYSIVRFRNTFSDKDDIGNSKIYLKDIIYYLYHNLLDYELMGDVTEAVNVKNGPSYDNYKALREWIEGALPDVPQGGEYTNWNEGRLSQIQLKEEIFNNGMNIPQFLKKFGVNLPDGYTPPEDETTYDPFLPLEGGQDNLKSIGGGLEKYLSQYNEYNHGTEPETLAHYSHDDLKDNIKKAIVIMTISSPNIRDGKESPIELFKFGNNGIGWETIQISLSEFQMYL